MNILGARRRSTRGRKIRSEFPARAVVAVLMVVAASIVALIVSVAGGGGGAGQSRTPLGSGSLEQANLKESNRTSRPAFKHSVIPGGVFTPEELQSALAEDAVAAAHYRDLNTNAIRTETVKQDRLAYVSYRKDDQIYWTRNKVRLSQGETILTDGTSEVRARCGNCISETPRLPVADVEPEAAELDRLVDDPGGQRSPSISAAIRAALESSLFGFGGTGGATASSATSGSTDSTDMRSVAARISGGGGGTGARSVASGGSSPRPGGSSFDGSPGDMSSAEPLRSVLDPGVIGTRGRRDDLSDRDSGAPPSDEPSQPGDSPRAERNVAPPFPRTDPATPATAAASLPERPSIALASGAEVPPGIDLPPGFNPAGTISPLVVPRVSSLAGPADQQEAQAEVASVPEPGSLLLLGGGAAVALLRRFRSSPRWR